MDERDGEHLPVDLYEEVGARLRAGRPAPASWKLEELKRRSLAQATRPSASRRRRGLSLRPKLVALLLVMGLVLSGGAAGVIAAGGKPVRSAAKSEYQCNSGRGNQSEPPTPPPPDCDPGKSPGKNKGGD